MLRGFIFTKIKMNRGLVYRLVKTGFKITGKASYQFVRDIFLVLVRAIRRFNEVQASKAAAAMTYYTLFSLFPLLLFLVAVSSSVLKSADIQAKILEFTAEVFPTSYNLVESNIEQVLRLRGAVSVAGMVGLLWSATAVFSALMQNVNEAWHSAKPRNFFKNRLMALVIVAAMVGLVLVSLFFTTITNLFSRFDVALWNELVNHNSFRWRVFSNWGPMFSIFLAFLVLYWWGPNTKVRWQEAAWGALVAATGWELVKGAFGWYISSRFARHQLVYGSLGAVIALMLWIYLSNLIILFGAHISAAIGYYRQLNDAPPEAAE